MIQMQSTLLVADNSGASILFNIKINNKLSLSKVKSAKKYNLINIYKYWLDEIIKKNLLKT